MILKKPTFILTILSLVFTVALAMPQSAYASTPGEPCADGMLLAKYDWSGTAWVFDSWHGEGSDVINFVYPPTTMNIVQWYADPGIAVAKIVVTDGGGEDNPIFGVITIPDDDPPNYPDHGYFTNAVMTIPTRDISNILFCGTTTPVTLASFSAQANRGAVTIKWTTATEIDTAGFMLFRSTTADGPRVLATAKLVAAQGSGVSGASYSFTDTPGYGTFYYWLEDVDFSGQSALHGPVAVKVLAAIRLPFYRPSLPGQ